MLVTDKVYFTSSLIAGAGCSADTFRAWRNRNGLFPETLDSGKWNKFSLIDVLTASLVSSLTHAGISAQRAVDTAMKSAPLFEKLFDATLTKKDVLWPSELLARLEQKLWPEKTHYPILIARPVGSPSSGNYVVELFSSQTAAHDILQLNEYCTVINLRYLFRGTLGSMAIANSELETSGKIRTRPGHAKLAERRNKRGMR